MFFRKVVSTLGLVLLVCFPLSVSASVTDCDSKDIIKIESEMRELSDILRIEYSLYGEPPFENAPIEEFEDYLMDGIPNPRSNELKNDKRYIRYIECKKILNGFLSNK